MAQNASLPFASDIVLPQRVNPSLPRNQRFECGPGTEFGHGRSSPKATSHTYKRVQSVRDLGTCNHGVPSRSDKSLRLYTSHPCNILEYWKLTKVESEHSLRVEKLQHSRIARHGFIALDLFIIVILFVCYYLLLELGK